MTHDQKQNLRRAVEKYLGRELDTLQVCPDPNVKGTYAIRATCRKWKESTDFLVESVSDYSTASLYQHLEEVEFETFPPKVKN